MKKVIYVLATIVIFSMICGCGEKVKDDNTFLQNLAKGLDDRWVQTDKEDKTVTDAEKRERLTNIVQCEIDAIGNIDEYVFTDSSLKELATDYVASLNEQKEAIPLYGKEDDEFTRLFTHEGYAGRAKDIYMIHNDYTIPVNEKSQDALSDLFNLGKTIELEDKKLAHLNDIVNNNLTLEFNGDDYEIIVENVTEYTYDTITCKFTCFDKDGVQVDSASMYLSDFKPGDKKKDSLLIMNDEISTVKVVASYSRNYADNYETVESDTFDVTLINDYYINIVMQDKLPLDLKYISYDGIEQSEITVTDFTFTTSSWMEGESFVELRFSGRKKYENPEGYSKEYIEFDWSLLDASGEKVDGDTVYISSVKEGETFKDEVSYVSSLKPGDYTLRLSDHTDE